MKSNTSVRDALKWGTEKLEKAGVESPIFDAEVLLVYGVASESSRRRSLSAAIPIDRAWLFVHSEKIVSSAMLACYKKLVARRERREPVAYILGHKEFYGLDFLVNRNVLIPRPETELLVEQANVIIQSSNHPITIVDVGTGSGAIAVAIVKELGIRNYESGVEFFATDISSQALSVARKNARRHGVEKKITFLEGNLLESIFSILSTTPNPSSTRRGNESISPPARGGVRGGESSQLIIIANLPYLPTLEWRATAPEVRKWEPRGALDGGKDGLRYYRDMFGQLYGWFRNPSQPPLNLRGGDERKPPLKVIGSKTGRASAGPGGRGSYEHFTIMCEICPEQSGAFKKLARKYFPSAEVEIVKDLAGNNRVAIVRI